MTGVHTQNAYGYCFWFCFSRFLFLLLNCLGQRFSFRFCFCSGLGQRFSFRFCFCSPGFSLFLFPFLLYAPDFFTVSVPLVFSLFLFSFLLYAPDFFTVSVPLVFSLFLFSFLLYAPDFFTVSVSFSVCFFVGCGPREGKCNNYFFIKSGRGKDKVEESYEAEDCQTLPTPPEEIHT